MAELLLLEGEDLPELMARVRDQFGPRATIVRAERVRSGGIAGFFSREHYELTVEVPDVPRPALRLVPRRPAGDPFEAALDAADRAEAEPLGDLPVSTAGPRFAAVLEHARALAGEPAAGAAGPAVRAVPLSRVDAAGTEPGVAAPGAVPTPLRAAEPRGANPDLRDPRATGPGLRDPLVADPFAADPLVADQRTADQRTADQQTHDWGPTAIALLGAGVPAALLDRARCVADVLDRIPEPPHPPRRPGQVLVLVGEPEAAASVAALLRHQWRLPEEAVLTAGEGGLTSPSAMVRWRVRAGEADHPWVLVVGTSDDQQGRHLAADLVAMGQPNQAWAVVDARTKPEDAARWLEQVGAARRLDAIAVEGLLETSDPGTVLGLGLPVVWADGLPASRVLWAAVLGQGVEAALARGR